MWLYPHRSPQLNQAYAGVTLSICDFYPPQYGAEMSRVPRYFVRKNLPPRSSTRLYPVRNMRTNARYLVSVPDNGDSRWSRYGLPAL